VRVTAEIQYPATPDAVFAMLTDQAFQDRKLKRTGALSWTVDISTEGGGAVVTSTRDLPTDQVPEAFRAFVGSKITLTQTETWGPAGADGARTGTLVVRIGGAPVRLDARLSLGATATGTTEKVEGDLKASVPLIGGKIERGAEPAVRAAIEAEERIGQEWLAGPSS
jgi:Protein of unknown function (DUF2505)